MYSENKEFAPGGRKCIPLNVIATHEGFFLIAGDHFLVPKVLSP